MDSEEIKRRRIALSLTQKELADAIGKSRKTLNSYEKGASIPESTQKLLEIYFEGKEESNKIGHLKEKYNKEEENKNPDKKTNFGPTVTGFYYPEVSASAGLDRLLENDELTKIPISIPNWGKGLDFVNVYGDSMYPKYCAGEIIGLKEVEMKYLNFGHAYVVIMGDGEVYIKYIRKGKDKNHWTLASENPNYEPREFHISLIRKVFIIKGVITKVTM